LLTTRLDNDDGLNPLYVERVQARFDEFVASGRAAMLVSFSKGYKYNTITNRLYRVDKANAAFLTLFEDLQKINPHTVYYKDHSTLSNLFYTVQDDSIVGWLMVVHGGNVLNRIALRDKEVPCDFVHSWYGDKWPGKK
jgi:hypothetical protein